MAPHTFPTNLPYSMLFSRQNNDESDRSVNDSVDNGWNESRRRPSTGAIIGIVVAIMVLIGVLTAAYFLWRRNRKQKQVIASRAGFVQQGRPEPAGEDVMTTKTEHASVGEPVGERQESGTVDVPPTYQMAVLKK